MLALMSDVDHPSVRLKFRHGQHRLLHAGIDPCDELERVKHLVWNVHVKDIAAASRTGISRHLETAVASTSGGSARFSTGLFIRGLTRSRSKASGASRNPVWKDGRNGSRRSVEHLRHAVTSSEDRLAQSGTLDG